jgi:hypothetical protein
VLGIACCVLYYCYQNDSVKKSAVAAPGNKENENEITADDSDVEMGQVTGGRC